MLEHHVTRDSLALAIETLITVLDAIDGDPDLENGHDLEDDFTLSDRAVEFSEGPGCSITDPGGCEHDGREMEDGV